jgi:hypothetical protein
MTKRAGGSLGREVLLRSVLKTVCVEVPEWEGDIYLRQMSGTQTMAFTALGAAIDPKADPGAALRLAAWVLTATWVDDGGSQVLTANDIDDLLATQTADVINRLATRAMQISGLAPDAIASAEKNSESSRSADSGTS